MYPDDALALVDHTGTVLQFVSRDGNTVTATEDAANGMTSTSIGSAMVAGQSLQSDDRGVTYYTQTSTNKGTIPACYARGTLIQTPAGEVRIKTLKVGDRVCTADGGSAIIRWICCHGQEFVSGSDPPVRFSAGSLGPQVPKRDLVVSSQHRMAIGVGDQLSGPVPVLVPAKALADLPGVHVVTGCKSDQWWHILCDNHMLIRANDAVSEICRKACRWAR